jgi:type VI secretion system secreted protein VgrG
MPLLSNIEVQINGNPLKSFQGISINQNLYGIDLFEITCRYDSLEKLDAFIVENTKDFLGATIVIQTRIKVKDEENDGILFKGYVTQVQGSRSDMSSNNQIVISGGSSEIMLNRKPTNRAFLDMTLEDIVIDVLKPYGLNSTISIRNKLRFPYVVQYEESDLEFLKRLSIRYGEWFYFNGKKIVFGEVPIDVKELHLGTTLMDINYELRITPVKFSLFANDPLKSDVHNYQSGSGKTESNLNLYGKHALNKSKEFYAEEGRDYYEHLNVEESQYKDGLKGVGEIEEASDAVNLNDISGSSIAGFLSSGMQVKITCPGKDGKGKVDYGKYLVTSVQHILENTLKYSNHFKAIPAEITVPENTDPYFVKNTYHQMGRVIDNEDPKKLGRIKIKFGWMEDKAETPWIKVVSPYTNANAGFYFVPAIDSRVLVGFEDGDVEKPYCLGSLYDEDVTPDSAHAGNYDSSNAKIHAIRTQSGQTIELHDEGGSEKIRIYDTNGNNEITLDSANGEIKIKATNKLVLNARDIELNADGGIMMTANNDIGAEGMNINLKAKSNLNLKSTKIGLKASATLKAEGNASAEISSSGFTIVKGTTVNIN